MLVPTASRPRLPMNILIFLLLKVSNSNSKSITRQCRNNNIASHLVLTDISPFGANIVAGQALVVPTIAGWTSAITMRKPKKQGTLEDAWAHATWALAICRALQGPPKGPHLCLRTEVAYGCRVAREPGTICGEQQQPTEKKQIMSWKILKYMTAISIQYTLLQ